MNNLKNFSIIIPHYAPTRKISKVLESIVALDYPASSFEVIVVLDNAKEGISSAIKNRFPFVRWLENQEHIGTARAKNLGAQAAQNDWLVFLDDDLELTPSWLSEMAKAAFQSSGIPCFQAKVFFDHNAEILNSAGGVANLYGYSWDRGVFEEDEGQYDEQKKILFATSCAMMIRRDVFQKVGGFDANFFYMGEDYDLGLRLYLAGEAIHFVPTAACFHQKSTQEKEQILHSKYYLERNRILVLLKNYPLLDLLKITLGFIFLKCFKYTSYLFRFSRQGHYSREVLRGWLWILKNLPEISKKRKAVHQFRERSIHELFNCFPEYKHYFASVREKKPISIERSAALLWQTSRHPSPIS